MAHETPPDGGGEFGPPTGPDESELPDEIPDPDELDPFEEDGADFDDINDFVEDEWSAVTKARDRVRSIIVRASSPLSVADVADLADVSKPTAREELNQLSEDGIVQKENSSNGNVYQRNPSWHRYQCLQHYLDIPKERLEAGLKQLEQELSNYKETYDADVPEDLILSPDPLEASAWRDISHWRTAQIDAEYIRTALQLDRLRRVEETASGTSDGEEDQQLTSS